MNTAAVLWYRETGREIVAFSMLFLFLVEERAEILWAGKVGLRLCGSRVWWGEEGF